MLKCIKLTANILSVRQPQGKTVQLIFFLPIFLTDWKAWDNSRGIFAYLGLLYGTQEDKKKTISEPAIQIILMKISILYLDDIRGSALGLLDAKHCTKGVW